MQPILQLGDVAFVRPSIATDGVENQDLVRDLTLPDLFASIVGDLLGGAEPENMAEEVAPDEASVEPDSDMKECHQQSDESSKSEHHQLQLLRTYDHDAYRVSPQQIHAHNQPLENMVKTSRLRRAFYQSLVCYPMFSHHQLIQKYRRVQCRPERS